MFKAGRCYARKVVHGIMEEDSLQRSSAAAFHWFVGVPQGFVAYLDGMVNVLNSITQ